MRRVLSLLLAVILVLGTAIPVFAADADQFTDIEGHWARSYIEQAVTDGLMNGTSATTFAPNDSMTRAMFVTVLGRFANVNPDGWKINYDGVLFRDIRLDAYYSPYVNWATRIGITQGIGGSKFDPDGMITREQMLTMLQRFADLTGKTFAVADILGDANDVTPAFTDAAEIASWAKSAVENLRNCGIVQGIPNSDGTLRFAPKNTASRAEAATIFCRMKNVISSKPGWNETFATLVMLDQNTMSLEKGESITLKAQLFPAATTNQTVTWISSNPGIATVEGGKVSWVAPGVCTIYAYSSNGCRATCDVVCEYPPVKDNNTVPNPGDQNLSLANGNESYAQKCERIFGKSVSDPRAVYASKSEALADMVSLTVPVWDINSSGAKYTRYFTLEVHKNIAATVDQIFREIYACPAQYPIHSLGGFRYEARSEHNCGLAIDINPNENYYCSPQGQALVGSFFSPESSEYSIPVNGEIDQIFNKYGFTRGIYWNSGYKDYMHYSFFAT